VTALTKKSKARDACTDYQLAFGDGRSFGSLFKMLDIGDTVTATVFRLRFLLRTVGDILRSILSFLLLSALGARFRFAFS